MNDDVLDLNNLVGGSSGVRTPLTRRISVVNSSSKSARSGGIVGMLNEEGTSDNFETIRATPLKVSQSRIWFYGNNQPYFCRSDNGLFPIESASPNYKQQAISCNVCPKAKWGGKSKPPPCQMVLDVTFYDHDKKDTFVMSFKGTSRTEANKALVSMSQDGGITHYEVLISVEQRESSRGDVYYNPVFADINALDPEIRQSLQPLVEQLNPKDQEDLAEKARVYQEELAQQAKQEVPELIEIDLE